MKKMKYIGFMEFDGTIKKAKKMCSVVNKYSDPDDDPEASFITTDDDTVNAHDFILWDCLENDFVSVVKGQTVYQTVDNNFYVGELPNVCHLEKCYSCGMTPTYNPEDKNAAGHIIPSITCVNKSCKAKPTSCGPSNYPDLVKQWNSYMKSEDKK